MKRVVIIALLTIFTLTLSAQHPAKYWVEFKDKKDSPYSVDRPEEFLSPRAIEKRQRFNIPITEQDLPVNESYIKQLLAIDKSMVLFTKSKWLNGVTGRGGDYGQDSEASLRVRCGVYDHYGQ